MNTPQRGPDPRGRRAAPPAQPPAWQRWIIPLGVVVVMALVVLGPMVSGPAAQSLTYTSFVARVTANQVATATVTDTGAVSGQLVGGADYTSQIPTALNDPTLYPLLSAHNVAITATSADATSLTSVLLSVLPYVLTIGLFVWLMRRARKQLGAAGGLGGGLGAITGAGRSKAKVYDKSQPGVRFADVAGYEGSKAEVAEVVDFLKDPGRYERAGAKGPRGC